MAFEVNKRIFGSPIPKDIQDKLNSRQNLSRRKLPNESLDDKNYVSNFENEADLSSRTPFARLWTAVNLLQYNYQDKDKKQIDETNPIESLGTEVYVIGNHVYNNQPKNPNDPIFTERNRTGLNRGNVKKENLDIVKGFFPKEYESDKNVFTDAPPGIKSITSQTEGMGAIKKTSVNFRVFNYADYQNIYLKYFLRPGAQMFVDFGWDVRALYDPTELIKNPDTINEKLFGPQGYVSTSGGDVESLYGTVSNYNSKVQDDGSVDISLEIMSTGTALISKDMSKGDAAKIRRRVSFGLDVIIMKHLEKLGYVSNIPTGGNVTKNFKQSQQFSKNAIDAGLKTKLSSKKGSYDDFFETDNINQKIFNERNFPSQESVKAGVFFTTDGSKDVTEKSMFISYGLFEDLILNREFGFADGDFQEVLDGKNSIRFDSSNHFLRWSPELKKRQGAKSSLTDLSYLYPHDWQKTYNQLVGKKPKYPDSQEEYKNLLETRNRQILLKSSTPMTPEQKEESIIQYEYSDKNKGLGYQTIDGRYEVVGGYDGDDEIAKSITWERKPYRVQGEPFCINLGGRKGDLFNNTDVFALGDSYTITKLGRRVEKYEDCNSHPNTSLNGGRDWFVGSVWYESDGLEIFGKGSNDFDKPLLPENYGAYQPSVDGNQVRFTAYKNKLGFVAGKDYYGGIDGVMIEDIEDTDLTLDDQILDESLKRIPVRDLFVSVATIKKAFINNTRLPDVLKEIYSAIRDDSGELIDLQVSANDYSQTKMSAIDRGYIESELGLEDTRYFTFNVNSRSTLVKKFDISYEVPSDDYSSALAIQSMTSKMTPTDSVIDYLLADKILQNTEDNVDYSIKYYPNIGDYQGKRIKSYSNSTENEIEQADDPIFSSDSTSNQKSKNMYKLLSGAVSQTTPIKINPVRKDSNNKSNLPKNPSDVTISETQTNEKVLELQNLGERVVATDSDDYYLQNAKHEYFTAVNSTLLPFEVTLNIYGISSLVVGDTFQVSYLPKRYRDLSFFQITGISHNIENTGWTTEISSKMRMKSNKKNDQTFTKNIITKPSQSKPVMIAEKTMKFNGQISHRKIERLGFKNFKDFVIVDRNFIQQDNTAFKNGDIFKFTWGGGNSSFQITRPVIAMGPYGITPDWPIANSIWSTILENKPKLEKDNPNLEIMTFGDGPPPTSNPVSQGSLTQPPPVSTGYVGTLNGYGALRNLDDEEADLLWQIVKAASRTGGNVQLVTDIYYWTYTLQTRLIKGESYYMYTSEGYTEVVIVPASTNDTILHSTLPSLFPVTGHPFLQIEGVNQMVKSFDDMKILLDKIQNPPPDPFN